MRHDDFNPHPWHLHPWFELAITSSILVTVLLAGFIATALIVKAI